jgi:arsenate reductase-like glutaredoxin family protein
MLRRLDFYTHPEEPCCDEIKKFLESLDLDLRVHDLSLRPMNFDELSKLIRYIDIKHFISTGSKAFKKFRLDRALPSRKELIELMASDNELIRKPIVVSGRLMTVGCNRQKIMEMLQIKNNGSDPSENPKGFSNGKDSRGSREHRENRDSSKDSREARKES